MPKDHLEIISDHRGYRLQWFCVEESDYGAVVGEGFKAPTKNSDLEWYTAEIVCYRALKADHDHEVFGRDAKGFWWDSRAAVTAALRQIKAETKAALSEAPWPEWAIKAKAAGWKPPKGWKP